LSQILSFFGVVADKYLFIYPAPKQEYYSGSGFLNLASAGTMFVGVIRQGSGSGSGSDFSRLFARRLEEPELFLYRGAGAMKTWLLPIPLHKSNTNYYKTVTRALLPNVLKNGFNYTRGARALPNRPLHDTPILSLLFNISKKKYCGQSKQVDIAKVRSSEI
jgi:hypothetical protein